MPRLVAAVKVGAVSSTLAFALLLHYLALGLPFIGYSSSLRGLPVAWKEFVSAAEQIKAKVAAETGYLPMLIGMDSYSIASELGFYRSGRTALSDITSQNLFGQDGLMFGIWGSARPYEGRVAIMYGLKEESLSDDDIAAWFDSIGPVERRIVQKIKPARAVFSTGLAMVCAAVLRLPRSDTLRAPRVKAIEDASPSEGRRRDAGPMTGNLSSSRWNGRGRGRCLYSRGRLDGTRPSGHKT